MENNKQGIHKFFYAHLCLILLTSTATVFHVIAYFAVKSFYSQHLPHYDSMGSYTKMFEIINTYRQEGFREALKIASAFHLSWLQSFFALIGAPFLNATPESVQLYNSLAVFLFMLSIYLAAKSTGASELKSYLLSLMVFLPDVFYEWQGGLLDLQRDPSFMLLLGASYFLFFAHIWRPSYKKGILLGFIAGLTVMSRGNAVFMLIAIMGPIIGLWTFWKLYTKDIRTIFKNLMPAIILFLIVAGPNLYYTLGLTVTRYQNPYVAYAIGTDSWLSFASHWAKPFQIIFGRVGEFGGHTHGTLLLSLSGLFFFIIVMAALRLKRFVKFKLFSFDNKNLTLFFAGIWCIAITLYLIIFSIKLKPLDFGQTKFPFYPSMLGVMSFFFIIGKSIYFNDERSKIMRNILCGLLCTGILILGIVRLKLHTPEPTPQYVKFAREMSDFFAVGNDKPKVVAFIWHDTISFDTVKFYLSQKTHKLPRKFFYTTPDGKETLDFAVRAPSGTGIPALLSAMKEQIEENADYLVISTEPGIYGSQRHNDMFIFQYGQPVVDSLIKSDRFKVVFSYELWGTPFAILENTGRLKT